MDKTLKQIIEETENIELVPIGYGEEYIDSNEEDRLNELNFINGRQ